MNFESSENKKQDSEHMVNVESATKDDKSQETYDSNNNGVFNVPTGTTATLSVKSESIDVAGPVLIGISGIFLIISIIFAIFFCKHQQKRNKKTSK